MSTRILIADDSAIIRECVGRLLGDHSDWEVCGEASDGEDAISKAKELDPDLVVMDLMMPKKNGIDAAREIGQQSPGTPILLCTICLTPQLQTLARSAGVSGTLPKGELNKVVTCCETLLQGRPFFPLDSQAEPSGVSH
jgi:DNA-binding NarL/FixJ family response regulator